MIFSLQDFVKDSRSWTMWLEKTKLIMTILKYSTTHFASKTGVVIPMYVHMPHTQKRQGSLTQNTHHRKVYDHLDVFINTDCSTKRSSSWSSGLPFQCPYHQKDKAYHVHLDVFTLQGEVFSETLLGKQQPLQLLLQSPSWCLQRQRLLEKNQLLKLPFQWLYHKKRQTSWSYWTMSSETHCFAKPDPRQKDDEGLRSGGEEIIILPQILFVLMLKLYLSSCSNYICHHAQIIFVVILKLYLFSCSKNICSHPQLIFVLIL